MIVSIFIFSIFIVFIFLRIKKYQYKSYSNFKVKHNQLENSILIERNRLEKQKQKAKIVDEYKKSLNNNKQELISKIVHMNNSLFEEINKTK